MALPTFKTITVVSVGVDASISVFTCCPEDTVLAVSANTLFFSRVFVVKLLGKRSSRKERLELYPSKIAYDKYCEIKNDLHVSSKK